MDSTRTVYFCGYRNFNPNFLLIKVVTTSSHLSSSVFAIHIDRAQWNIESSDNSTNWWNVVDGTTTSCVENSMETSSTTTFVHYSWTQYESGLFDLFGYSYNNVDSSSFFVLYNSTPTFLFSSTYSSPASPCTSDFLQSKISKPIDSSIKAERIEVLNVPLVSGKNYTIVMSTLNAGGRYGIWIRPSISRKLGTQVNFKRPNLEESSCVQGSSDFAWLSYSFTTQQPVYIVDNPTGLGFDTVVCVYKGLNLGNDVSAPLPCASEWIGCQDTGDKGAVTISGYPTGTQITLVQTTYTSLSNFPGDEFSLLIYTGIPISELSKTTGTSATSDEISSGGKITLVILLATVLILI